MSFNTAISAMMIFMNEIESVFAEGYAVTKSASATEGQMSRVTLDAKIFEKFLKILSPFAPHMTEEIWHNLGNKSLIVLEDWPKFDPEKLVDSEIKIIVQVNSKMRGMYVVPAGTTEAEIIAQAKVLPGLAKWLEGKEIQKEIYVPGKLVNFVVS
jgi:leucyl-tRNA synthetase